LVPELLKINHNLVKAIPGVNPAVGQSMLKVTLLFHPATRLGPLLESCCS
jgi:hypothetical protein